MEKFEIILIIGAVVIVAVAVLAFSGQGSSSQKNTTYFTVDGNATVWNSAAGYVRVYVPIHQTVNENLTYTFVPYIDGVPSNDILGDVPLGVDVTKTFKLKLDGADPKTNGVDIIASPADNTNVVLQKTHITFPANTTPVYIEP